MLVRRITAGNSNMASKWTHPSGAEKAKKKNTDEEKCSQVEFKAFVHDVGWKVAVMLIFNKNFKSLFATFVMMANSASLR